VIPDLPAAVRPYRQSMIIDVPVAPPVARAVQGACLVVGPVLNAAATFQLTDGRYGVTGGTLVALSSVLWLPGLLGVWEVVRARRPVLGTAGAVLSTVGAFGGIAFGLQGFYEGVFGLDQQESLGALAAHPIAAQLVLWLPGPVFPLSLLVLAAALARTRVAPYWMAGVLAVGAVLWPVSRIPRIPAIAHLADAAVLVPSVGLGVLLVASVVRAGTARTGGHPAGGGAIDGAPGRSTTR
jgi:hypothetical protein